MLFLSRSLSGFSPLYLKKLPKKPNPKNLPKQKQNQKSTKNKTV